MVLEGKLPTCLECERKGHIKERPPFKCFMNCSKERGNKCKERDNQECRMEDKEEIEKDDRKTNENV